MQTKMILHHRTQYTYLVEHYFSFILSIFRRVVVWEESHSKYLGCAQWQHQAQNGKITRKTWNSKMKHIDNNQHRKKKK